MSSSKPTTVPAIQEAFDRRYAIYRKKMDKAAPFARDSWNRHDAMRLVCEAFEILADEAGLLLAKEPVL